MELIGVIGIMVNCALIGISSQAMLTQSAAEFNQNILLIVCLEVTSFKLTIHNTFKDDFFPLARNDLPQIDPFIRDPRFSSLDHGRKGQD